MSLQRHKGRRAPSGIQSLHRVENNGRDCTLGLTGLCRARAPRNDVWEVVHPLTRFTAPWIWLDLKQSFLTPKYFFCLNWSCSPLGFLGLHWLRRCGKCLNSPLPLLLFRFLSRTLLEKAVCAMLLETDSLWWEGLLNSVWSGSQNQDQDSVFPLSFF